MVSKPANITIFLHQTAFLRRAVKLPVSPTLRLQSTFGLSTCGQKSVTLWQPLKLAGRVHTGRFQPIMANNSKTSEGNVLSNCKSTRSIVTSATCNANSNAKGPDPPSQSSTQSVDLAKMEEMLKEWESAFDIEDLPLSLKNIHHCHLKAVKDDKEAYEDPVTGFEVFTILSHLKRGVCCGNACRHCPYKHINVSSKYRDLKIFNSAFYV